MTDELKKIKKKSDTRKRQLRSMNDKIQKYIALADAALSDAARWKKEAELWKLKFETLNEKKNGN